MVCHLALAIATLALIPAEARGATPDLPAPGVAPGDAASRPTAAGAALAPERRSISGRLRVALPPSHVSFGFNAFSLATLSAGLELRNVLALEGGAGLTTTFQATRPEFFFRIGLTPTLRDWRAADGGGWKAQANILAGWRHLARSETFDGDEGEEIVDGVTGHVGVEWSHRSAGAEHALLLRALAGGTFPLRREATGAWRGAVPGYDPTTTIIDFLFDLGIAF